mmetsp:Transcript_16499/g.46092  ORF Transcript_16499/g.46092 Transcript_16499/m.46092 type:complete len:376 (-) Transcript_16499:3422-4549(-)
MHLHVLHLGRQRGAGTSVEGQQVGRDLVLDEEPHEVLRQLDLLREGVAGEPEQRLQLRLDLHDANAEHGRFQLHAAECLREALLLRRERLDGVLELLGRRHLLEEERDQDFVLVLDDDGVLGVQLARSCHVADDQDEGRELACASGELEVLAAVAEAVLHPAMQRHAAAQLERGGGVQRDLQRSHCLHAAAERFDRLHLPIRVRALDAQETVRMVVRAADCMAERLRSRLEELGVVVPHELVQIVRPDRLADGRHQLGLEHLFDVRHAARVLLPDDSHVLAEHDDGRLRGRHQSVQLPGRERLQQTRRGFFDGLDLLVQQPVDVGGGHQRRGLGGRAPFRCCCCCCCCCCIIIVMLTMSKNGSSATTSNEKRSDE